MKKLTLQNISKSYPGNIQAVDSLNLDVNEGDFIVLLGPSGCGKTTVLRMIAGLEDLDSGSIKLDGTEISGVPPRERGVSMIFQDYALYPHLTVRQNIAFPLQMHRFPKAHINETVEEMAASLKIDEVLNRKPRALSGGQRQRVAIARALVRKPKICLMDEPFSNLDTQLRVEMRGELARIHKEHNMTVIFVTHDQTEAMALGTRIVVMKDGVIQQAATSRCLYQNPANLFVARFFGSPPMNAYPATLSFDDGAWSVRLHSETEHGVASLGCTFPLDTHTASFSTEQNGASVVYGIRPEHIELALEKECRSPNFSIEIERVEELGSESYLYASFHGAPLVIRLPERRRFAAGTTLCFSFNPNDCYVFDAETGVSLLCDHS